MLLCGYKTEGKATHRTGEILRPKVEELYRSQAMTGYSKGEILLSVSHTGPYWFCLADAAGNGRLGLDLELDREIAYAGIASRWFPVEEQRYVALKGRRGFLQLWTAKEALAKYSGKPLMSLLSNVCLSDGQRVLAGALGAQISEIDLSSWDEDLVCTIAFDPRLRKSAEVYLKQCRIEDPACL